MSKYVVERNHKREKLDRGQYKDIQKMHNRLKNVSSYSELFGDRLIGNRIDSLISLHNIPYSVIEKRINYVIEIFESNGYSEKDAINFIINNPNIIECGLTQIKINYILLKTIVKDTNVNVVEFISKKSKIKTNSSIVIDRKNDSVLLTKPASLHGVYNVICDMFIINGYDQNDINSYLIKNTELLKIPFNLFVSRLAILNEVNMLDTIFFEHPDLINENISDRQLFEQYAKTSTNDMNYAEFSNFVETLKNDFISKLTNDRETKLMRK